MYTRIEHVKQLSLMVGAKKFSGEEGKGKNEPCDTILGLKSSI